MNLIGLNSPNHDLRHDILTTWNIAHFSKGVLHMVEIASLALDDRAGMTQKDAWLNVSLAFLMKIINSWCIHPLVLIIIIMSMFIAPVCVRLLTLLHHSQLVWHWRICQLRWEQYPKSSDESPSNGGRLLISAVSRPQASKRWGFIGEQQQQPCWMVVTMPAIIFISTSVSV